MPWSLVGSDSANGTPGLISLAQCQQPCLQVRADRGVLGDLRLCARVVHAHHLDAGVGQWISSLLAAGPRAIYDRLRLEARELPEVPLESEPKQAEAAQVAIAAQQ